MSYESSLKARIIDAGVLEMNRLADFGLIEGRVRILLRRSENAPIEKAVVLTNVASRQGETLADLRMRLCEDAVRLWALSEDSRSDRDRGQGPDAGYRQAA